MTKEPKWNVYVYNQNKGEVEPRNIFTASVSFNRDYKQLAKKVKADAISKSEFESKLQSVLLYAYWSKCEWEITLGGWPATEKEIKIDATEQVLENWEQFVNYSYEFAKNA